MPTSRRTHDPVLEKLNCIDERLDRIEATFPLWVTRVIPTIISTLEAYMSEQFTELDTAVEGVKSDLAALAGRLGSVDQLQQQLADALEQVGQLSAENADVKAQITATLEDAAENVAELTEVRDTIQHLATTPAQEPTGPADDQPEPLPNV